MIRQYSQDFAFYIELECEILLEYCQIVGHLAGHCHKNTQKHVPKTNNLDAITEAKWVGQPITRYAPKFKEKETKLVVPKPKMILFPTNRELHKPMVDDEFITSTE